MFPVALCSGGNLSKTCTEDGWTNVSMESYIIDCGYNLNHTGDDNVVSSHSDETPAGAVCCCCSCKFRSNCFHCNVTQCAFLCPPPRKDSTAPSKCATPSGTACRSSRSLLPSSFSVSFGKQHPDECKANARLCVLVSCRCCCKIVDQLQQQQVRHRSSSYFFFFFFSILNCFFA